ncbi:MAG TPA: hypothetical protein VGX96_16905 [Candidatus Elarobacter sp.]|jgi:hypothetical protein|nr:hypothetical protein [Candidatus Elarobacter sp.]
MFLVLALVSVPFAYDGALKPGQSLTIRDINGSVRVRTGDRLAIRATKHAERSDPNEVAIHVENRPNGIVVCVRYPPEANRPCDEHRYFRGNNNGNHNDTAVDFDVTVPHGIALDAATVNGSVDAVNDGPADASTVNGAVRIEGRDVRTAKTVNGSVTVRVLDRGTGSLEASTVNGSVDVSLPPGSGANVHAKTLTGGISADGLTVERPRYGPGASADGTLGDGARRINLETVNGSITLRR